VADPLALLNTALSDRYTIERELGRGGMATVYLAQDLKHERRVALKVLHPELAATIGPSRFLQEIRVTSRLQHPHILPVFDSGESSSQLWYTMPFVDGDSLRQRLTREKQLAVDSALRITRDVAEALDHAHRHGIVHRDIKPENILLEDDQAVVADFGIAQAIGAAGGERLTETGLALGTPTYMSPEQGAGAREVDGRSDIYSLACVLYEMLAGEPPFTGPTAQVVLARHSIDPVPSLRTARRTVPAGMERAIVRALAKVPADRYPTAAEFADALTKPAVAPRPGRRRARFLGTALIGGAVATAAVLTLNAGGLRGRLWGEHPATRIRTLAVLPLESLSADSAQGYLAEGMTDELITDLTQLGALQVVGRTSVMRYRGSTKTAPEIARELRVDAVVAGTVQRVGDRLRVAAQLVAAGNDQALWAKSYDRDVRDVLTVQSEIAQTIAQQIRIVLTPQEQVRLASARKVDPAAYEAYVRGRYFLGKRTQPDLRKGVSYFHAAIDADPTYAAAYSGLADCYNMLGYYSALPPKAAYPNAQAAARKALELDSMLAEPHTSLAWADFMFEWDWSSAEREFRRAILLNPKYPVAHAWYSAYLAAMGREKEAIAEGRRAQELDPLSLITNAALARPFYNARRYDEAIIQSRKTLEIDPHFARAHYWLGLAYEQKSMFDQAIAAFQEAISNSDSVPIYVAAAGHAYAAWGRRAKALSVLAGLEELSRRRYVSAYDIATIHIGLGDTALALQWLERAYHERSDGLVHLGVDPRWDGMRSNQRFAHLVRRVGLPL
jgi:TolB-like protein/tRNA A-37 threonylcarbamoyl transferase component Bud32